jgi:peptidoglycan/xylan/chitin deacetylase (PgdA/CDA1 family)
MKHWIVVTVVSLALAALALRYATNSSAHATPLPTAGQPRNALWQDDAHAAISFTFDDGLQCHRDIAAPMLREFGFRGTFYVVAGLHREHKSDPVTPSPRLHFGEGGLSWDEIRDIHNMGMEIGNHSLVHAFLNKISDEHELRHQVYDAADIITREVGETPVTFAFPYNEWSPEARKIVLEKHIAIRENWTDYGGPTFTTAFANALVQKALQHHTWLVPMIHGIDGGFLPLSSSVFRQHLQFIKDHEDELWVSTYADVARYQQERTAASLTVQDSVPGETTFEIIAPTGRDGRDTPLTVVLPLPLNENSDDVSAHVAASDSSVPIAREADRILVTVPPQTPITVAWH